MKGKVIWISIILGMWWLLFGGFDKYPKKQIQPDISKLEQLEGKTGNEHLRLWITDLNRGTDESTNQERFLPQAMDREFWQRLINKEYDEIYKINPDDLSVEMLYLLFEYCNELILNNQIEELEQLINGIIRTDKDYSFYTDTGYGILYLEWLYTISFNLYEEKIDFMVSKRENLMPQTLVKLRYDIDRYQKMSLLWGILYNLITTEYFLDSGVELNSLEILYGYQISNLNWSIATYRFDIKYSVASIKDAGIPAVGSNIGEIILIEDTDFQVREYYSDVMWQIRHLEYYTQPEHRLFKWKGYFRKRKERTAAVTLARAEAKLQRFGVVGAYMISYGESEKVEKIYQGFYDIARQLLLAEWEKKGLAVILDGEVELGDEAVLMEDIIDSIKNGMIEDGHYAEAEAQILCGGNILDIDYLVYWRVIRTIESEFYIETGKPIDIDLIFEGKRIDDLYNGILRKIPDS